VVVTDQVDFINKYGYPTEYNFKAWYNIYEYLRYVQNIHVMRVINPSWTNSCIVFGDDGEGGQVRPRSMVSNIYNEDIAFNNILNFEFTSTQHKYAVFNREVTQNEDIAVSICTTDTDFDESVSVESVSVFTDVIDELPPELLPNMELNQLYILNDSGTYSVQQLDLYDEDLINVETIDDSGTLRTKIKIALNTNLYDEFDAFLYTDLYFRNTSNKTINDTKYTIKTGGVTEDASYTYIILDENLNIYDISGKVVFYDVTLEWIESLTSEGYLLDEKKYVTVTPGAGGYITYSDIDYDYTVTNEYTAIRTVYNNKIQNGSTIKTFRQILNKDVDFTKNFVVLVFKKLSGLFSLMEVFEVADSRDTTVDAMYKRNFCEDVINQYSKLIYFRRNSSSTSSITTNYTSILNCVLTDSTATDYTDLNTYSIFETATNYYRYSNSVSLKYIMGIELDNGTFNTMNLASDIADTRKDCIAINSIWDETDYLSDYTGMIDTLLDQYGIKNNPNYLNINSTYNIVYDNMKMIYDEFNEKFRWIPIIGDIAGIYVSEDNKGNVYNACAGFQTTPIQNYLKMLIANNTDDELDSLSYHSINHVQKSDSDNNYYLYDILMYIDEELLTKRLNIRRTLNHFKYLLKNKLKPYFFQYNSDTLRKKVSNEIRYLINDMLNKGAIISGSVICDGSNNSSDAINNNELYINIFLQPTPVIRQIVIEINIEKGTVSLTESEI
jgi:hypothetical protein